MSKVYDIPTRLFHWIFSILFLSAFLIAKTFDDDSTQYPYHMLIGLTLGFVVLLRILWGLWGSRYARFSSFALHPRDLLFYFKNFFSKQSPRWLGHNPASSWAALVMMGLALGLAGTGYFMAQDLNKEVLEEVHELFANAFILVVIAHVAGVILHTLKHRDAIGLSMIHGKKVSASQETGIEKSHGGVGFIFLLLLFAFSFHLVQNYDANQGTLNFFGAQLQLGEGPEQSDLDERGGSSNLREDEKDGG